VVPITEGLGVAVDRPSGLDERQQIRVDDRGLGSGHPVRETRTGSSASGQMRHERPDGLSPADSGSSPAPAWAGVTLRPPRFVSEVLDTYS
jgi:hypothetical protein